MRIDHLLSGLADQTFLQLVTTMIGWLLTMSIKALRRRFDPVERGRRRRPATSDAGPAQADQPAVTSGQEHGGSGYAGERVDRNVEVHGGDCCGGRVHEQQLSATVSDRHRRHGTRDVQGRSPQLAEHPLLQAKATVVIR
jgi:hypothetical protein